MPRSDWGNKGQQRQIDAIQNKLGTVIKVGRMNPVPIGNLAAKSDLMTRGAQVTFEVVSLEGIDHFVLIRNFSRDPGSAQIIKTWPVDSLKSTPQVLPVALKHIDNDPAISGKIAFYWVKAVPQSQKTTGNTIISGPQEFDASRFPTAKQIAGDFAAYQSYTPTTQPLTATTGVPVNSATITIAPFQIQYPFDGNGDGVPDLINYNGGTITPLLDATIYFVYFDDPTYAGGAETYIATVNNPDVTAGLHRQYVGTITTPAHGGGGTGGHGGGGGTCFSGNTQVITKRGVVPISDVRSGDRVFTRTTWREVEKLLIHDFDGEMLDMGGGELVTPTHRIYQPGTRLVAGIWLSADQIFRERVPFTGKVFNLELKATILKRDAAHCYLLKNGKFAHNFLKA